MQYINEYNLIVKAMFWPRNIILLFIVFESRLKS